MDIEHIRTGQHAVVLRCNVIEEGCRSQPSDCGLSIAHHEIVKGHLENLAFGAETIQSMMGVKSSTRYSHAPKLCTSWRVLASGPFQGLLWKTTTARAPDITPQRVLRDVIAQEYWVKRFYCSKRPLSANPIHR